MAEQTNGDRALESLYNHLRSVYSGHSKADLAFVAKQCDDAQVPYFQQNNIAAMAEEPAVHHSNGISTIIAAAKQHDWRPLVVRK